jgi:eukaryotic-like serine/threonine-protein kinase
MAEARPINTHSKEKPQPLSGVIAGRFVVGERLGDGGMGEVYRAQDIRLKRTVAVKRLSPQLRTDPSYRSRFHYESERVSRFSDAHIAAIYDVLEEQSEIFLVMEYIEGENLRQRLCRPITLEEFFEIATQCAEALSAAHERGIVHCDIKPENIMVTTKGQVKILDFGVAKHLPRSDQSSTADPAAMAGTPAYMSPEVLMEKIPDGRADIFSLGVVFYEMLTGQHPFLASSLIATTDRIRHETPAPIRRLNPMVPESLEAVVMKAMAKDLDQRYARAADLLEDLRVAQAGVTPSKLSPVPRPRPRTNRMLVGAIAVIVLAIAVYGIHLWRHRPPVLFERGWVLITDFDSQGDNSIPDAGVREGLAIALQQSRYVNVFPRARVYDVLRRMRRENVPRIDENLGREICQRENLQVLLTGDIEHLGKAFQITVRAVDPVGGKLLFAERERFDNKEEFFEKADALAKRAREDLGESLNGIEATSRPLAKVTTSSLEALQLYSRASDAMVQENTDQAAALFQSALELDPNFAMAHLRLSQCYGAVVGKNEKALTELERAYALRQGVTDREQRRIEADYFDLHERYEDAARSLTVLVNLYPDDAEAHEELAAAYYNLNQLDKAISELSVALRLNPFSTRAYRSLVLDLAQNNADEDAIATFAEAQKRGIDTPQLHWGLGMSFLGQGKLDSAREEFRKLDQGTDTDKDLKELYLVVADLYEGKLAAARAELVRHIRSNPADSGGLQFVRRYFIGRIDLMCGRPAGAIAQADSITRAPESELLTFDWFSAGILYARAGQTDRARRVLSRLNTSRKTTPSSWNNSTFHNLQGEILLAEKQPATAESAFLTATTNYPANFSHIGLARTYQTEQRWALAVAEWERVSHAIGEILRNEFPPDLVLAHLELARALREIGDHDRARTQYNEFLRLWRNADDLRVRHQGENELQQLISEASYEDPSKATQSHAVVSH